MRYRVGDLVGGRYRLENEIGQGGFGVVWRAEDRRRERLVAVKFLHERSDDAARRFTREAEALMRVRSDYCLRPIDFGRDPSSGEAYLVTELLEGLSLGDWLDTEPSLDDILDVACAVARGLRDAHREGVFHRDLKPSNVIVRDLDGKGWPVIIDFGIAKLVGHQEVDVTETGEVLGTPGFMSPEQLRGRRDINASTDMYAFGVLLFAMLEGRLPFGGESPLEIAMQHLTELPPPVVGDVPQDVRTLVARLLEKEPDRRPGAAAALRVLRGDKPARTEAPREAGAGGRTPLVVVAISIAVVLLSVIVIVFFDREDQPPVPPRVRERPSIVVAPADVSPQVDLSMMHDADATSAPENDTTCDGLLAYPRGVHRLGGPRGALVRIPRGYDGRRPYPIVIMFHDGLQTPALVFGNLDHESTESLADYIIVAPSGRSGWEKQWDGPDTWDDALRQVDRASGDLCVAPDERYALGYGEGGKAALMASCIREDIQAVATFAHRFSQPNPMLALCTKSAVVPLLAIAPNDDVLRPADGSAGCTSGDNPTLDQHRTLLLQRVGCVGRRSRQAPDGCVEVDCPQPFTFCEVDGGRRWPHGTSHDPLLAGVTTLVRNCDANPPTTFGVTRRIFDFFDDVRARRSQP